MPCLVLPCLDLLCPAIVPCPQPAPAGMLLLMRFAVVHTQHAVTFLTNYVTTASVGLAFPQCP